jgi:hypothetical protein
VDVPQNVWPCLVDAALVPAIWKGFVHAVLTTMAAVGGSPAAHTLTSKCHWQSVTWQVFKCWGPGTPGAPFK